jgi:VanZ family protein
MSVSPAPVRRDRWGRWALVVVWTGVVLTLSSAWFGGGQTGSVLLPVIEWLFPGLGRADALVVHAAIRKAAHVAEYFVLGVLVVRALRLDRPATAATAALAIAGSLVVSLVDESHQALLPGRTGALADVALDAAGAVAGAWLAIARDRLRGAVAPLQTS